MVTQYEQGNTVRTTATLTDNNGDALDPDQSGETYLIKITIENEITQTEEVSEATMTRSSEGVFYYDWETDSSTSLGEYKVYVEATVTDKASVQSDNIEIVEVI